VQIIIENLVQNAVRYTERGGIKIHARSGVFEIKDSGCGFDFQHAKQQGVKAKNSSGFGIGLSLVERLCVVNGLSLAVESTAEGSCIILKSR
jgi:signal transduction histidine kinase